MSKYQHTLNLPKTDFPMRASLSVKELAILKKWQDMDLYGRLRSLRSGKKIFLLHDGPPYANGDIHLGHAVNKILKDIIIKSYGLSGYDAPYVPGWDCHGLPIELAVEKKVGKIGNKIDEHDFRDACRSYAKQQIARQSLAFQRLGVLGDWQQPYLTMDFKTEAHIMRALGRMIESGCVHKGEKPVYWCMDCGSALAEAEIEYEEKTSDAIDVCFLLANQQKFWSYMRGAVDDQGRGDIAVVIWTTTPWTLPANQAVCIHPDFKYVLLECRIAGVPRRLLLAEGLYKSVMQRWQCEDYRVLASITGASFEGCSLRHPFYDREVPVVLGRHVTLDAGTGAVHTAPGHGHDDYFIGKAYDLPLDSPVAGNGCFLPDTDIFAGQHISKANENIMELMLANKTLLCRQKIQHGYPHCWRHRVPVIFRATPQWFIRMDGKNKLREHALESIKSVKWHPDWGLQRISAMVGERPDWCISRQRNWGVPIAVFVHKKTGELHPRSQELIATVADLVEQYGIDAWFKLDPHELLGDEADSYSKVTDTLDVWFDSGVTHGSVLQADPRLNFPADLYLEGSDQYRGWFQSSLLTSVAVNQKTPYKSVLSHGFTVDAEGRKMSKSKGNIIDPHKIMNSLGADVLRLWVASTDYRDEMSISDEILKRMADNYRKIRNTARYLLSNLDGFDKEAHCVVYDDMLELDKWAVERAVSLQKDIIEDYGNYQFHQVSRKIQQFCSMDMSSFYLDITKDRMYTMPADSLGRRSAQTAMHHILQALVRWLAPMLSYTAEELWQHLPHTQSESVFLSIWYEEFPGRTVARQRSDYWRRVIHIRDEVSKELEKLRIADRIGSSLDAEVKLFCDSEQLALLKAIESELLFIFIVSSVSLYPHPEAGKDAVVTGIAGLSIQVSASGHDKCARCWHRRADVNNDDEYPQLCARCIKNLNGAGELRHYA